jgi:hypothetical protein
VQRRGEVARDLHRVIDRECLAPSHRPAQRATHVLPVDVLHREEVVSVDDIHAVDVRDVRVIETGGQLRLVEEQLDELRIVRELGQDLLEHEQLLEALRTDRAREVELGHAPAGDPPHDLVRPEPSYRSRRMVRRRSHRRR